MATPQPPSSIPETTGAAPQAVVGVKRWMARFKGPIVTIAGVGAVLSGLVGWYTTYKTVAGSSPASPVTATSAPAVSALSILVLPFANQTGDANKAYIADALTSSITGDLARIRDSLVIGVATANSYKDKPVLLQQIGRELGVRFVLQGSVQVDGQRLRISAQLADTQTQATLWTDNFEGDSTQLFALQEVVTARIANSIGREIVVIAARDSAKRSTTPKVADLMLRVRAQRAQPSTLENQRTLETLNRLAIKLDPTNDEALGFLSRTLWFQARVFAREVGDSQSKSKLAEAYQVANAALQLNPSNFWALQTRARELGDQGDMAGRQRNLEAALALQPANAVLLGNMSVLMDNLGRSDEAITFATRSLLVDPKAPARYVAMTTLGAVHRRLGHLDLAVEWLSKAIADNTPDKDTRTTLALAYAQQGNEAMAQRTWAEQLQRLPDYDFVKAGAPEASAPQALKRQFEQVDLPLARKMGWVKAS